jgi:hypothetical protein
VGTGGKYGLRFSPNGVSKVVPHEQKGHMDIARVATASNDRPDGPQEVKLSAYLPRVPLSKSTPWNRSQFVMKSILRLFILGVIFFVQGCAATEMKKALDDGIPLVNIIREPSGTETVLVGKIQPRMDFSSSFSTQSKDGVVCSGEVNNRGIGTISCNNGWILNLAIPQDKYKTLNGNHIQAAEGIGAAVGWGTDAEPDLLRSLL